MEGENFDIAMRRNHEERGSQRKDVKPKLRKLNLSAKFSGGRGAIVARRFLNESGGDSAAVYRKRKTALTTGGTVYTGSSANGSLRKVPRDGGGVYVA